jgi:hypothetical protein
MQRGEQLNLALIESSRIRTNRHFSSIPKVTERFHTVSRRGIKCVVARHPEVADPLGAAIDVEVAINGWYHDTDGTNLLTLANEGTGLLIISHTDSNKIQSQKLVNVAPSSSLEWFKGPACERHGIKHIAQISIKSLVDESVGNALGPHRADCVAAYARVRGESPILVA